MSTKTTSAGRSFRLSAIRTRKLASDRQKEKNFMESHPQHFFLSPPVGEDGKSYPAPTAFLRQTRCTAQVHPGGCEANSLDASSLAGTAAAASFGSFAWSCDGM